MGDVMGVKCIVLFWAVVTEVSFQTSSDLQYIDAVAFEPLATRLRCL